MGLFSFGKNSGKKYPLSDEERYWIHEDYGWLFSILKLNYAVHAPYVFDAKNFPLSHSSPTISPKHLLDDLCALLELDPTAIELEMVYDERDQDRLPYQIEGSLFETELKGDYGNYHITVANSLLKKPNRLLYNLIKQTLQIKLFTKIFNSDYAPTNETLIIFSGIFSGFGPLLIENMYSNGRSSDAGWEVKWNYTSEVSYETLGYGIALFQFILDVNFKWIENLSGDLRKLIAEATAFISTDKEVLELKNDFPLNQHFIQAQSYGVEQKYQEAIELMRVVAKNAFSPRICAWAENDWGYFLLLNDEVIESISHFKKAHSLDPLFAYAVDNLGYALLKIGDVEEGLIFIEKAFQMDGNDFAYGNRNRGLYFYLTGDFEAAERSYQEALRLAPLGFDFLEFHYAQLLNKKGEFLKAREILAPAIARGEKQAIELAKELGKA